MPGKSKQHKYAEKIIGDALTFDDVTLVPDVAEVPAHEVSLETRVTKNIKLSIPLVSSAMDTVTESAMAITLARLGGMGVIHRNLSIEEQAAEVVKVKAEGLAVGAAIGTSGDYLERTEALVQAGVDAVFIDLAHGSTAWGKAAVSEIKKRFKVELVAGNAATYEGAKYLADAGADAIKVGIGGGSICTTRIITGVGVPNVTAILEVRSALEEYKIPLIIDGGIRYSGDMVKAIAAGADCGMCGSILAGTEETPGSIIEEGGKKYKLYRGMSVKEAMTERTKDRYYLKMDDKVHTSQGVSGLVPLKGSAENIVKVFIGGIRAGMENVGAANIAELQKKAKFYRVTDAGGKEAHPHGIQIMKNELNYSINR